MATFFPTLSTGAVKCNIKHRAAFHSRRRSLERNLFNLLCIISVSVYTFLKTLLEFPAGRERGAMKNCRFISLSWSSYSCGCGFNLFEFSMKKNTRRDFLSESCLSWCSAYVSLRYVRHCELRLKRLVGPKARCLHLFITKASNSL